MSFLNSMRDVAGVPFYPVVFQILMVLTFALHIIFVNLVIGGTALAIWGRLKGSDYSLRLSKAFARANTIFTSLAIVLGVAPLLFVQVIYDPFWYTAGNLSAWWTLLFLVTIAAAFSFAYLFYLGKGKNGGSLFWAIFELYIPHHNRCYHTLAFSTDHSSRKVDSMDYFWQSCGSIRF